MTRILKLFDYQEMLTTGRITAGHSSKRNPIGGSHFNKDASEMESKPMEKHLNKYVQDKRTIYTEYSGFPSSSPPQQDTLLFDPLVMPENCSTGGPRTRQVISTTSAQLYRQQPYYLQEVVKDSMYYQEEARKQPSKTNAGNSRQKSLNQTDDTYGVALYGRKEQLSRPSSYQSKEVSFFSITKEAARFSYDEKDSSFKPRGDVSKYQDMARLSRDGSESSIRNLKSGTTQPDLFTNPSRNNSGTQIRSPSVVAKLMGLDALPNTVEPGRPVVQASVQSKILSKESSSPRWKNPASTVKPVSRLPVEPAPWKQVDRSMKDSSLVYKTRNSFPSVYSEIEKRLKDLEFSQSGKDLRALKQILEAMQEKEEDEDENGKNPRFVATDQKSKNELIYSFTKQGGRNLSRNNESPIVIMKPAKHTTGKSDDYPIDELSPGGGDTKSNSSSRASKSTRTTAKNGNTGSLKSNGSIGSRVLHKKSPESEKQSGPRSRTRSSKQENGSSSSSTISRRRHRSSNNSSVRNDEEMSEISNESTNNSAQSDGSILSESKMDIEAAATSSERNLDMTNLRNPFTKTFKNSVSCLIEKESILVIEHPEIAPEYPSPVSVLDSILDMDESPSPIKHQDKTTSRGYEIRDSDIRSSSETTTGSGNPFEFNRRKLKNIENLVQKLQRLNSSHDEARTDYIASLYHEKNTNPDHRYISEILLASGILLISDIGSSLTNFQFHPSGHPINPGLFLVLEQTKASTFLATTTTTHLKSKQEKHHRKMIFDTINELLARKLVSLQQPFSVRPQKVALTTLNAQKLLRELCLEIDELQSKKTKHRLENEEDGLKDVLYEDVMNPLDGWLGNNNDTSKVSSIVLDIERLVFKDLVDEVLVGEIPGLRNNNSSRRRQLFPK